MDMVHPKQSTVNDLRETLRLWADAHRAHQEADERWRGLDSDLKGCKQHAAFLASNNAELKNAEQRAAFAANHLREACGELLDAEAEAAFARREIAAELERLTEALKTLRVICHAETAEREAKTAHQQAEAFARLPF